MANALMLDPREAWQVPQDVRKNPNQAFNQAEGFYEPDRFFRGGGMGGPTSSGGITYQGAPGSSVLPAETETAPAVEPYDFTGSPGYQFRFEQGRRGVENSLIGRGLGLSGRAAKELTRFGQDYGAAEFGNEFARNATLAGLQAPALNNLNMIGGNYGNNAAGIYSNMGNAQGSAYMSQGQSMNNAIQGGLQNYMFYNAMGG